MSQHWRQGRSVSVHKWWTSGGCFKRRAGYFTPLVYCYGLAIFTQQSRHHGSWDVGVKRLRDADSRCCPLLGLATAPDTLQCVAFVTYVRCRTFLWNLTGTDTQKLKPPRNYTQLPVWSLVVNPLNTKINPICHLLALLGVHHIFRVSGLRVKVRIGTIRLNFGVLLTVQNFSIILVINQLNAQILVL
jgi:hypothetical protein